MKNLTLCLTEEIYAQRLASYIRRHYAKEFRVSVVWDEDTLDDVAEGLITDDWERYLKHRDKEAYYLDFDGRGEGINPYQSAKEIMRMLLWNQAGNSKGSNKVAARVILFYTPTGSSTQSIAAKQYAQQLGRDGSCIYIPIKEYRVCKRDESAYDLSELCYRIKRGVALSKEQIMAATEIQEDSVYLRGFRAPQHFIEMENELKTVINFIVGECDYKTIVVDLQVLVPGYDNIFDLAEEIYSVEDTTAMDVRQRVCCKDSWEYFKEALNLELDKCKIWKWGDEKFNESGDEE